MFQQALAGRGPKDFLYGDLLLAKARAQELAKDSGGAIATYKQYLKDLPSSDRVAGRADPPGAARQRGLTAPRRPPAAPLVRRFEPREAMRVGALVADRNPVPATRDAPRSPGDIAGEALRATQDPQLNR